MSKRPYTAQYSSPNIVLVPAESEKEPPVKKLRVDSIPLPTHQLIQNVNSIQLNSTPVPQAQQNVPVYFPLYEYTNPYNQGYNVPMQAVYPPDVTVPMPCTLKEIVPNDLPLGSNQLGNTIENVTPKKSWASNYLTSIGQAYKKPIKLNLSSSRKKIDTSNQTQNSYTTSQSLNKHVNVEKRENINRPQTETREIIQKPVTAKQSATSNSQNLNNYVSAEKSVDINRPQTKTREINQKLVTVQQPAKSNCHLSVSSSSTDSKVSLEKGKQEQNKKSFTNTTHFPTISHDTHNKIHNAGSRVKENKKSLSLKRTGSDPQYTVQESEINTACDSKQFLTNILTGHDNSKRSHVPSKPLHKNSLESEKDSKSRLPNKADGKSQKVHEYEKKDKYKTKDNDKQKPSTSSSHKYKDSDNNDSHSTKKSSRKHDDKKTASKFIDSKVSKNKSSQANKDYKILKEIIQDKIKKVRESKALMDLKNKKSDERSDQRLSSDKRSISKASSHSKSDKISEKDKRELKVKSKIEKSKDNSSKKYSPKIESEETSKKRKQSPPVKSVVQIKDNLRKSPLNTHGVDKKFDLRSKLSRRGLSEYFAKLRNAGKMFSNISKAEHDNLIITVENQNNNESTTPDVKEKIKEQKVQKVKTKKYKKVKLVINLICENTESSDTDDNDSIEVNDTCAMTSEDLSFLDDLNIDEIVDSLNHCKNDPNSSNSTNNMSADHDNIICIDDFTTDDENSDASTVHLEELDEIQKEMSIKRENEQDNFENITGNELIPEHQRLFTSGTIKTEICDNDESPKQEPLIPENEIKKELLDDGCNNNTLVTDGLNKKCSKITENLQKNDCTKIELEKIEQKASLPSTEVKQEPSDDYPDVISNKEIAANNAKLTQDVNDSCYKIANESGNLQPLASSVLPREIKQETPEVSDNILANISASPNVTEREQVIEKIKEENVNVDYAGKNSDKNKEENKVHTSEIKQVTEEVPDNTINSKKPDDIKNVSERESYAEKNSRKDKVHTSEMKQVTEEVPDNIINSKKPDDIKNISENESHVEKNSLKDKEEDTHSSEMKQVTEEVPDNNSKKPGDIKNISGSEMCVNIVEDDPDLPENNNETLIANIVNDIDMKTVSNTPSLHGELQIPMETYSKNNSDPKIETAAIELNKENSLSADKTGIVASSDVEKKDVTKMTDVADKKKSEISPDIEKNQKLTIQGNSINSCSPKVTKKEIERRTETSTKQKQPEVKSTVNSGSPKVEKKELVRDTETCIKQKLPLLRNTSPKAEQKYLKQSLEKQSKSNDEPPKTSNTFTSKMVSNKVDDDPNTKTENSVPKNGIVKEVAEPENKSSSETEVTTNVALDDFSKKEQKLVELMEQKMSAYLKEPYTVNALIHRGRYSKIFQCTNSKGRLSAVKVKRQYNQGCLATHKDIIMTLQQMIPRQKLTFACLFKTFDVDNQFCFLMEYYPKNLTQTLKKVGVLHIDVVQHLSRQLVEAVSVLRLNNVVHADIKPGHILLNNANDRLKLCGFDSAYYVHDCVLKPNIGTVNYRAPELILGYSADHSIDVWSTALVMFEMATGHQLFPGKFNNDILFKQMCTLGYIPLDMIKQSKFANIHFFNTTFKRKLGPLTTVMKNPQDLYINSILGSSLKNAYYQNWGLGLSMRERMRDLAKLNSIYNLLQQMLEIHPNSRLPIEFVQANPFFDAQFSF